jgi:hypothetical protein
MKTYHSKTIAVGICLLMAILMLSNPAWAQQNKNKDGHQGANREKMEAQRVAFITQQLNLTPDEAKAFWPVYNEYDAKRQALKKSFRESGYMHKEDLDKLTQKEAEQILDNQITEALKFMDLRKEYHNKFKAVLPAVKILKLYDSEREFQKMLVEKMHNSHGRPPEQKK